MTVTYTYAPDVAKIAGALIEEHHTHLDGIRIEYVFRSEAAVTGGKQVWGKARKITGLNAYLATNAYLDQTGDGEGPDPFFVVEIAADIWAELNDAQRIALVDHELCHCGITVDDDGAMKLATLAHDLEEFQAVVHRHGMWRPEIRKLVKTADDHEQLSLLEPAR